MKNKHDKTRAGCASILYGQDCDCRKTKTEHHTPIPWHIGVRQADVIVYDEKGWAICNCIVYHGKESGEPKANAAFIVRAVNSHEALCEMLKQAREFILRHDELDDDETAFSKEIFNTLEKAEGE